MILKLKNVCWAHISYILSSGEKFSECTYSFNITKVPNFSAEGMAGYIECDVEFGIHSLSKFADLYDSWYKLPVETRDKIYYGLKHNGLCK